MIVAGHQPNYLPWLGFFDKMRRSDFFIIEDNVQFERQGFISRNRILTADGVRWLSVPVEHQKKPLLIKEAKIANHGEPNWSRKHWLTIKHGYCRAPYFGEFAEFFEDTYEHRWDRLIDLNMHLIRGIMDFLKIDTPLVFASSLGDLQAKKSELIVAQCKKVGADVQLAGEGCKDYIEKKLFDRAGIKLIFQDFQQPTYMQMSGGFVPNLSVIDFLFCCGAKSW
jgi:hypothetical protein